MSQQEQPKKIKRAKELARDTPPGKPNSTFIENIGGVEGAVEKVVDELNNWIQIVDVRLHRDRKIGIACKYRWTIKRWAHHDMDQWLHDNGWEIMPHRKADSYEHRDNEMEARYRKEIDGYLVHVNIHVEFTNDVFEALKEGNPIRRSKKKMERKEKARKLRKMKAGDG